MLKESDASICKNYTLSTRHKNIQKNICLLGYIGKIKLLYNIGYTIF